MLKFSINVQDLSIAFGDAFVVQNLNFSLVKGQTLAIVGESGSGKSISALALLQLLPLNAKVKNGQALFYPSESDVDLLKISPQEIQKIRGNKIAMIFQEPMTALNPVYTCGFQVVEMLQKHLKMSPKTAKAKCIELFKEVELPRPESIFDQYPHQISGGQKQRVMIAMALSCNPDVLIADEPTTALDVTVQKNILELIQNIQKQRNMGVIFISHDLGVVYELADEVLVMKKGQVVENGSTQEVFHHPKHPYTKGLIACRPPLDKRYKKLPTVEDFLALSEDSKAIEAYFESIDLPIEARKNYHSKIYQKEAVLSVENLKVYFPNKKTWWGKTTEFVKAVDGISFEVFPGETLGLIGESGCGKTTVGRTIVGLQKSSNGQIFYGQKNLKSFSTAETKAFQRAVQIIFQDPYSSLNPRMSVGKAIEEPIAFHQIIKDKNERKKRVLYLLNKVGLSETDYHKYPHQFSGGQRQRISIARTLALEPKFIICDESVSALDVSVQAQVLNLLNDLKAEFGLTYIFISHDLSVIKYMCDRMLVMNKNGQIEEQGECDELYENAQSAYTKKLIEAIPQVKSI